MTQHTGPPLQHGHWVKLRNGAICNVLKSASTDRPWFSAQLFNHEGCEPEWYSDGVCANEPSGGDLFDIIHNYGPDEPGAK